MSGENSRAGFPEPTAKEAMFFYNVIKCSKSKLEVDWEKFAVLSGYANGGVAQVRYGQIKRRLGLNEGASAGGPSSSSTTGTPTKTRVKKEVGSGSTKTTPSKIAKKRAPKKASKAAAAAEFSNFSSLAADDDDYDEYDGDDFKPETPRGCKSEYVDEEAVKNLPRYDTDEDEDAFYDAKDEERSEM